MPVHFSPSYHCLHVANVFKEIFAVIKTFHGLRLDEVLISPGRAKRNGNLSTAVFEVYFAAVRREAATQRPFNFRVPFGGNDAGTTRSFSGWHDSNVQREAVHRG
jgi:hypothetical protein